MNNLPFYEILKIATRPETFPENQTGVDTTMNKNNKQ
jgi:hypothetical protein